MLATPDDLELKAELVAPVDLFEDLVRGDAVRKDPGNAETTAGGQVVERHYRVNRGIVGVNDDVGMTWRMAQQIHRRQGGRKDEVGLRYGPDRIPGNRVS